MPLETWLNVWPVLETTCAMSGQLLEEGPLTSALEPWLLDDGLVEPVYRNDNEVSFCFDFDEKQASHEVPPDTSDASKNSTRMAGHALMPVGLE